MAREVDKGLRAIKAAMFGVGGLFLMVVALLLGGFLALNFFRIDVPTAHMAVLIKKTGKDLDNNQEIAPSAEYKGVQREFLLDGKHWRDPYNWAWEILPQPEVPQGQMGILVSLTGENLGYGEFMAKVDSDKEVLNGGVLTKGIVPNYLTPGRYAINPYLFELELHNPIVVPAGYRGVVTSLAGPMPEDPNTLLVPPGFRGVQAETLDTKTHYYNPYAEQINLVDCRSRTYRLTADGEMGFPSKDGFWIRLDGVIEFRVMPEKAAEVYVTFNDDENGDKIDEEIIRKVIMPIARSYCRTEGSKYSGRQFIQGETRSEFEDKFESVMQIECEPLGIGVLVAKITDIYPPQQIAEPIRESGLAKEEREQFLIEIKQQEEEQKLAVQQQMALRKQELIKVEQEVVTLVTEAMREQEVAVIKANEGLEVAKSKLEAAADEAKAIEARGQAEADVVRFNNEAEAAGWARSVEAFSGNGAEFARYVLNQKLAPAYRRIMANTEDSPIMDIFRSFAPGTPTPPPTTEPAPALQASEPQTPVATP